MGFSLLVRRLFASTDSIHARSRSIRKNVSVSSCGDYLLRRIRGKNVIPCTHGFSLLVRRLFASTRPADLEDTQPAHVSVSSCGDYLLRPSIHKTSRGAALKFQSPRAEIICFDHRRALCRRYRGVFQSPRAEIICFDGTVCQSPSGRTRCFSLLVRRLFASTAVDGQRIAAVIDRFSLLVRRLFASTQNRDVPLFVPR